MADTKHDAGGHGEDHGNVFKLYMIVALALSVATASSFVFNSMARAGMISVAVSFLCILTVAIIKATLVGIYFMHLKWDWKLLYFLIGPVFIMGAMMSVVLLPDIYFGPKNDMKDSYEIAIEVAKKTP